MSLLLPVRIALFYFMLAFTAFAWCLVSLVFAPFMAFRARYRFVVQNWCRCAVWLGKTLVGLRYEVHGAENVPARPCVILAKHQSTWETFFLSAYFEPLTQVLKRELLRVPFFGWAIMLLKPIAIDRDNPKAALRQAGSRAPGAGRLGADLPRRHPRACGRTGQVLAQRRRTGGERRSAGAAHRPQRRHVLAEGGLGQATRHHSGRYRPAHVR